MTKQEKIDILKKMMWMNFQWNFCKQGLRAGLCFMFEDAINFKDLYLSRSIPEILIYKKGSYEGYWWPTEGQFIPWWYRHVAIWKTIRQLKKS